MAKYVGVLVPVAREEVGEIEVLTVTRPCQRYSRPRQTSLLVAMLGA
jgi:hypothetical protein